MQAKDILIWVGVAGGVIFLAGEVWKRSKQNGTA